MDRNELRRIFQNKYNIQDWQRVLLEVFGVTELRREPRELTNDHDDKVTGYELGKLNRGGYEIGLYEFEIKGSYRIDFNRVGLRSLVKSYLNYGVDAAIVVYWQGEKWRVSYICDIKGEKTNPKRFTYIFGDSKQTYRTPLDRFEIIESKGATRENIHEAFSVEALNKDFYRFIARQFYQLIGATTGKGKKRVDYDRLLKLPTNPDNLTYQEFAVRLIGRTVFCWFLKEKKSPNGIPLLPPELLSSKALESNENYYHTILERIFFQTLNTPMKERVDSLPVGCEKIPFLNGGLFDYHPHDFYLPETDGLSKYRNELTIPDSWFASLFTELEQYNFTIDENSPDDIEVSVDPEMLGRIFENLLAEIDPDSGETARKATGVFTLPVR